MKRLPIAVAGMLVGSLAACGGGSQLVVRPPASPADGQSRPSATPSTTTAVKIDPKVSVDPSRHLRDGQIVHVRARGFGPNQSLVTIECVDVGDKTGESTCNIGGLSAISVGAAGTGSTSFTVRKGPFGSDNLSCTQQHPCILSVSQATLHPTQTASASISFG